ncbi:MAG: hypothetical protein IJS92_01965 [Paludibacteraceae bacterium]|nr:hypothetical protein [Paludibacteraceae bacterium]
MRKVKLFTLLTALICAVSMQAQCDLVAVPSPSSFYEPTHIVNGGFETQPTMAGSGAYRIPNGTNQGWNTTENGSNCFEWLSNVKQYHNDNLNPIGNYCVEMNADNAAALYQDLYTNGGDVIRWSLAHAARTKYCGPDEQYIRVDVGAPLYNGDNIVYPTGVNNNINTNINPDTKATYHYNGIDNPTGRTCGFNGQNLENLLVTTSAALQWYFASGVYVVPESQPVTRFAFVSEDNSSCGNLLDDITFSTLIGDLDATYGDNNSVVIKGYWGETDTSKKLIIAINSTIYEVDMTDVSGQNFVITMTAACYGTTPSEITIYHQDYVSAARTISVKYPISVSAVSVADVELVYDGNAHTIIPMVTDPESGYTLKYGTSYGDISLDELTYTTVGTYPIYYSISAPNYTTYKGQATLRITKTAFPTNIPVTPPTPLTLDYAKHYQTLAEAGSCTGYEMAYALGENGENAPTTGWSTTIPQGKQSGSYYVWYKVLGGENYEDSNPAYVVATINEPVLHTVSFTVNNSAMGSLGVSSVVYSEDLETLNNGAFALPDGWTNDATYPWVVENHTLKSGNGGQSSRTSTIQATYNFTNPGKISFSYRISSESNYDKGYFSIDNVDVTKINGISGSSNGTFTANVDAGTHTFKWRYSKDSSVNRDEDAFFIDNIVICEFRTDITNTTCISGDEIELVATPKEGCYFVRWDDNSTDVNRVVTINQDTTITAYFNAYAHDVTANLANGAYWATFYSNAANYQAPDGTQVFAVNLNTTTAEITMTEISDRIAKSGQGVVMKQATESSEPTTTITMTLTETAPAGDFSANSLQGTMTSITNPSYGNIYVLNAKTGTGAGFYKLSSSGTIGANKAYLTYSGGAGAREFFLFDEATGIEMPTVEDNADAVVYDLQGRRVQNPAKGVYIVRSAEGRLQGKNGKKTVIK